MQEKVELLGIDIIFVTPDYYKQATLEFAKQLGREIIKEFMKANDYSIACDDLKYLQATLHFL